MKHFFTLLTILSICFSATGQNSGLIAKKKSQSGVKNIVITEDTYNKITNPTLNKRKLSKIAEKEAGKPKRKDDPISRMFYEVEMLKNPTTGQIPLNIKELEKKYVLSSSSRLQNRLKTGGLSFTHSGPRNVGGRTRALAIDVTNSNTILAGGTTGGMWKSTNNGASWTRTTNLEDHPSVTAIAQDPRAGQTATWYYSTGEYIGSAGEQGAFYAGNGLFKSTDNGDTWTQLSSTASNKLSTFDRLFDICWNICVDPNNGDVYVATYGAIMVSKDGGSTWTEDLVSFNSTNPNYAPYTDVICTASGVKYATVSTGGDKNNGIWRKGSATTDTWVNITPASGFPSTYQRMVLACAPSNTSSDILYLLGQTPGAGLQGHSLWKLTYTSSSTWVDRSQNLPEKGTDDRDVDGYNSQSSYNMVIKVAPDNENMVFIGGTNLHRSDDGFATNTNTYWIGGYATENDVSQYPYHHPDVHSLAFKNDNATLICGHDGGLSITSNYKKKSDSTPDNNTNTPVDWAFLNNNYLTTQAYTVAIDHDITTSEFMLTGFQDNGTWLARSASASSNWTYFNSGDGSYCSILNLGEHFLSSSQNGVVYLETDPNDEANYMYARVDPEGAEGQLFINPFVVDANNSEILYYAAGSYVWRNLNIFDIPKGGFDPATKNWEKLEISKATGSVSALESSVYPAHILYYGTSSGKVYKIENAHSIWAKQTEITGAQMPVSVSGEANPFVSSIDANPLNANELLVSFSNYGIESIFYSKDGGSSWTAVSGNLEDGTANGNGPSVRSVAIVVSPTDTTYYAGTSTGLYSTTKLNGSSTTWIQEAKDKIGTTVVSMIKARRDGFIAAATHGNGVFTTNADYSSSAPVALIGMTKDSIYSGGSVDFMNRSIGDGITTWEWTFEGGTPTTSSAEHPKNIVYNTPGTYFVSLRAVNAAGENTQLITSAIVVKSVEAKFTASATSVNVGTQITFTDQTSGTPISWNWNFPGGTPDSSTERNPVVTYNTVGTYDVSLRVSDGTSNDTQLKTAYITVLDPSDFEDKWLYNVLPEFEDQLSQFVFQGDNSGYVSGQNSLQIDQYAEKFHNINPNLNAVKQVQIFPTVMQSNSSDPKIRIKIWNGTTEPDQLVYSKDVAFSDLTAGQFSPIDLDFPVKVNSDFFVGYEVLYETPVDTFAVAHLPLEADMGWNNTAYMHYNGSWSAYNTIFQGNPNTSLAIKALIGYDAGATGIEDDLTSKEVEKLLIYPNPMVNHSNVVFPNKNNQQYRLIVVDASGRVVRIIENITGNNVTINREQLKPGVHIINLSGEKIYKGKLLVK